VLCYTCVLKIFKTKTTIINLLTYLLTYFSSSSSSFLVLMMDCTCWRSKVDDIETKLDLLVEMYKADRQAGAPAKDDDVPPPPLTSTSLSSAKLLHGPPPPTPPLPLTPSLRPDSSRVVSQPSGPVDGPPTPTESLRQARPSRPMFRNLSDLGPRVASTTPPWPPVSVLLTGSPSADDDAGGERSTAASSPSSRRHPPTISESDSDPAAGQQRLTAPRDDDADDNDENASDAMRLLPVSDGDESRSNHVAPFSDHVTASSNVIGRTVAPSTSSDNSHTVIVL